MVMDDRLPPETRLGLLSNLRTMHSVPAPPVAAQSATLPTSTPGALPPAPMPNTNNSNMNKSNQSKKSNLSKRR